ncbi:MAG: D-alanine--D-alanine ligase [Gammaproteobacteria bacterium SG8_15]|nr:MAG: D-alanine--D-alanine ligase [Gammaproteobacteria bacterium SG8_15]
MTNSIDPKVFGKVAVLMGGQSAEREVSLKSGNAVLSALTSQHINAHGIDVGHNILSVLAAGHFDRVFIALHGRGGEDGTMQGALEILELPYTGSGVMSSALAMDKLRTKYVWMGQGLPTPGYCTLTDDTDFDAVIKQYGLPLMIKPAHEGSSIGMSKVTQANQLEPAYRNAAKYDSEVFAEQWITGTEYTVAILGDTALPVIRLETPNDFYDYDAKYVANTTGYHIPCGLGEAEEKQLRELALKAFKGVGADGWGRVDVLCDKDGNPYLIELNTVPGLTDHSLVPMAAKAAGISFEELMVRILEATLTKKS